MNRRTHARTHAIFVLAALMLGGADFGEPLHAQDATWRLLEPDRRGGTTHLGTGPRVWTVGRTGRLLVRDSSARFEGWNWYDAAARGDVAAVSYRQGGDDHELAIYVEESGGQWRLVAMQLRNRMMTSVRRSEALPGLSYATAAVAAHLDPRTAPPTVTAAVVGRDGRLCLLRWAFGGAPGQPICSATGTVGVAWDIVSLGVGGTPSPWFYFRTPAGKLARAALVPLWNGLLYLYVQPLGRPSQSLDSPLVHSVAAVPVDGQDYVFVANQRGELFAALPSASGAVTWYRLPALPGGTVHTWKRTALTAVRWQVLSFYDWRFHDVVSLFVLDTLGRVHRIDSGLGPNPTHWNVQDELDLGTEQQWLGSAVAMAQLLGPPSLWGQIGSRRWSASYGGVTLGRFRPGGALDDLLFPSQRPFPSAAVLGRHADAPSTPDASYWPATEGNLDTSSVDALAAAIERRYPWRVLLSWSEVGGASFSTTMAVTPSEAWGTSPTDVAMSDPFVAYDPATGRFHFIAIETRLSGSDASCNQTGTVQAIVYRTAASPYSLAQAAPLPSFDATAARTYDCDANGGACVVGSPSYPALVRGGDHGALVLAPSGSGPGAPATPHVVLWHYLSSTDHAVYHWWKPEGLPPRIERIDGDLGLTVGPPSAFVDAAGDLYAYSFNIPTPYASAYPFLCRIDATGASGARPGQCDRRSGQRGRLTPSGAAPAVVQPSLHLRANPSVRFQTWEPFAFAAHPTVAGRLYAVFPGGDNKLGPARIHFLRHREVDPLSRWTVVGVIDPALPAAPGEAWTYFDPEISVDREGAIVVTFSGARVDAADATALLEDRVRLFVAVSTDEGRSFTVHGYPPSELSWQPSALPRHCSRPGRPRFLGEYRRPAAVAARHLHMLPISASGSPVHYTARFVSASSIAD